MAKSYVKFVKMFALRELNKDPNSPIWNFVDFMQDDEIDRITRRCETARGAIWKISDFYRRFKSGNVHLEQ